MWLAALAAAVLLAGGGLIVSGTISPAPREAYVSQAESFPRPVGSPAAVEGPLAVFIGDSYTAGEGGEGVRWPDLVGDDLGWSVQNRALGGTGYTTASGPSGCGRAYCGTYLEVAAEISGDPSYIIVAGGRNDPGSDVGEPASALFTSLIQRFPDAQVVVILPWFDAGEPPGSLLARADSIREAAEDAGIYVIDSQQPFGGRPELISDDEVHPNAEGYRVLAEILTPLLEEIAAESPAAP